MAQGDILYRGAAAWARLAASTARKVLMTMGASADPTWDNVKDSDLSTSDVTTNNVTTSKHGFAPKAPNDSSKYLDGTGSYSVPSGSGATPIGPRIANVKEGWEWGSGNAAVHVVCGMPGITAAGATSNADDTDGLGFTFTTGAVAGNNAYRRTSLNHFTRDAKAVHYSRLKTASDITNISIFSGFSSGSINSIGTGSDPGAHCAMFRYHTGADGTAFWRCITKDATTLQVTTTSVAVNTNTVYAFRVELDASEVRFYIDETLVATHSTNIPTASVPMQLGYLVATLTNATRAINPKGQGFLVLA